MRVFLSCLFALTQSGFSVELPRIQFAPKGAIEPTPILRAQYNKTRQEIEKKRQDFKAEYLKASNKSAVMDRARLYITTKLLHDIFPAWYGTPWRFYGTSVVPGKDDIACGYSVTTTLEHVGFRISRITLAQQPSQYIIKNLTQSKRFISSGKSIEDIEAWIKKQGAGIYIAGLDQHVGFIVHDGTNLAFIHSTYYKPPKCVVAEPTNSYNPLARSKYRVISKILDDGMMRKWILSEKFAVKYRWKKK